MKLKAIIYYNLFFWLLFAIWFIIAKAISVHFWNTMLVVCVYFASKFTAKMLDKQQLFTDLTKKSVLKLATICVFSVCFLLIIGFLFYLELFTEYSISYFVQQEGFFWFLFLISMFMLWCCFLAILASYFGMYQYIKRIKN